MNDLYAKVNHFTYDNNHFLLINVFEIFSENYNYI